jgi:LysM repeat protein
MMFGSPRAAAAGLPRRIARALVPGGLLLLAGCFATTKRVEVIETDATRRAAWTDERLSQMQGDLDAVRAENEALRQRMDDISDQIASLGGEVSSRLTELAQSDQEVAQQAMRASRSADQVEVQREKDREEMLARMNAILDEVLKENERLARRVDNLEANALTFGRVHKVAPGESVAGIAKKYGVTVQAIADANGLSDASLIQVGQELVIPGTQ